MAFVSGKALGDLVVKLLRAMRVDRKLYLIRNKVLCYRMSDVGGAKLPCPRNNNNYFQMHHSTRLDGLTLASARFDHAEVSDCCRKLYFECTHTLVVSTKDRLDKKHCHYFRMRRVLLFVVSRVHAL